MERVLPAMGTLIEIRLACPAPQVCERGFAAAHETLQDLDRKMSLYHDSELTRVNAAAGTPQALQSISPDTQRVIEAALDVAARSEGYFDPTIAPVLELYGIYKHEPGTAVSEPSPQKLAAAFALVNYRYVTVSGSQVALSRPGMKLDLGGIAKGYALDQIALHLKASGVVRFSMNFGGHLLTQGIALETTLRHPKSGRPWLKCNLVDGSLSVSAQTERFVRAGARYVGHIIHPHSHSTTEPNQVIVVYHRSAMFADAWSTALFFAGDRRFELWARQNQLQAYRLSETDKIGFFSRMRGQTVCQALPGK